MCVVDNWQQDFWALAVDGFVKLEQAGVDKRTINTVNGECVKLIMFKNNYRFEVTIAYSWIYACPVIYFRCFHEREDRFIGDLDLIQGMFPKMKSNGDGIYSGAIAIDTDPVDQLACFMIHPCRSAEIMAEMTNLSANGYLISYWNLYGFWD